MKVSSFGIIRIFSLCGNDESIKEITSGLKKERNFLDRLNRNCKKVNEQKISKTKLY